MVERKEIREYYHLSKDCQMYLGKTQVKVRWMEAPSAFKYLLHLGESHAKHGKSERDSVESLYSAL